MSERDTRELLSFYLDNELDEVQRNRIKAHLDSCPSCQEELSILRQAKTFMRGLDRVAVSPDYDLKFKKRFMEEFGPEEVLWVPERGIGISRRILRGLEEALRPIPVAVRIAAVLILAFFSLLTIDRTVPGYYPSLVHSAGLVKCYDHKTEKWQAVALGRVLKKGDFLNVGEGAQAEIRLAKFYRIRLKPNTVIFVKDVLPSRRKGLVSFDINKGTLLAKTEYDFKGNEMRIEFPQGRVIVKGTGFMVEVLPEYNKTWVGVSEGVVRVAGNKGGEVLVEANKKTLIGPGAVPDASVLLTEEELDRVLEIEDLGKIYIGLGIGSEPDRVKDIFKPAKFYISGTDIEEAQKVLNRYTEALLKSKNRQVADDLEKKLEPYVDMKCRDQFLILMATYYAYAEEYGEAIKRFRDTEVKYPDSEWAGFAECAIGLVYEEKIKNAQLAAEAYKKTISDYPESIEAGEAGRRLSNLLKK